MECRTKTGLLLLIISQVFSIISTIILFSFLFSYNPENITSGNITNLLVRIIPAGIVGGIGGLLGLIGAILLLIGRKEFGEKHEKFMIYAVVIFVISMIVGSLTALSSIFMDFSTIYAIMPISAVLGGLVWIFALYQLENKTGRYILYTAYALMIVTSIIVAAISITSYGDIGYINSSSYSQFSSNYQWMGNTGLFNIIGSLISTLLLIIAFYIPYKRIISGALVPISNITHSEGSDRICPNCGQGIPFDANICPYCSKRFDNYI